MLRAYFPLGYCITPLHPTITSQSTPIMGVKKPRVYRVRFAAFELLVLLKLGGISKLIKRPSLPWVYLRSLLGFFWLYGNPHDAFSLGLEWLGPLDKRLY